MKKFATTLLIFVMLFCFSACGGGSKKTAEETNTPNNSSLDSVEYKDTWKIKNYIGKNLATIGSYDEWDKKLIDEYGESYVTLIIISEDGSYIDLSDTNIKKNYVVTQQNIEADTELKLVFDGDGLGYVESQNIEEIDLHVKKISNDLPQSSESSSEEVTAPTPTPTPAPTPEPTKAPSASGIDPDFKAAMDSYEKFFDDYVDFMKKYQKNPGDLSLLKDYAKFMSQYTDTMNKLNSIDQSELNDAELAYYMDTVNKINKKILEIA